MSYIPFKNTVIHARARTHTRSLKSFMENQNHFFIIFLFFWLTKVICFFFSQNSNRGRWRKSFQPLAEKGLKSFSRIYILVVNGN